MEEQGPRFTASCTLARYRTISVATLKNSWRGWFDLSRYHGIGSGRPTSRSTTRRRPCGPVGDGTLVLGHDGCGMYWHLVITGPERGQVWQITDVGAQPCAPRRDFFSWYEYWLDGHDDWWSALDRAT